MKDKHLAQELEVLITRIQSLIEYVWVESLYSTEEATRLLTLLDEACLKLEEMKKNL